MAFNPTLRRRGLLCRNGKLHLTDTASQYLCEWGQELAVWSTFSAAYVAICRTDCSRTKNLVVPTVIGAKQPFPSHGLMKVRTSSGMANSPLRNNTSIDLAEALLITIIGDLPLETSVVGFPSTSVPGTLEALLG